MSMSGIWGKMIRVYTIRCDDHIPDMQPVHHLLSDVVGWRKNDPHTPGQNGQEETVPGRKALPEILWVFQRAQIMDRQRLISDQQGAGIGR